MVSIPLTFADGSTAVMNAPRILGIQRMSARPDMSGGPKKREWVRPAVSYSGTLVDVEGPVGCVDGRNGRALPVWEGRLLGRGLDRLLVLRFGDWYVQVVERIVDLGYWARHLVGEQTRGGWLRIEGTGTIRMGPQRDGGDSQIMFSDRHNILGIWILGCQQGGEPEVSTENGSFARFCSGDGRAEIHVQGRAGFVKSVAEDLTVTEVEPAYPLMRYAIVP